jgi:hypothetical protein
MNLLHSRDTSNLEEADKSMIRDRSAVEFAQNLWKCPQA